MKSLHEIDQVVTVVCLQVLLGKDGHLMGLTSVTQDIHKCKEYVVARFEDNAGVTTLIIPAC